MQAMIEQSLAKLDVLSGEEITNFVAEMKRIEAIYPDSVRPKYMSALMSLNYSVTNPQANETPTLLAGAMQDIEQMDAMKDADKSDVMTLRGFYYMTLIVKDPAQNGTRYYRDVTECYEKALKINPENQLARELQARFKEGMEKAMTGR